MFHLLISSSHLKFLPSIGALENLKTSDIYDYSGCKLVKFFVLSFNRSIFISSFSFNLTHFDVLGPSLISIKGGSRYFFN